MLLGWRRFDHRCGRIVAAAIITILTLVLIDRASLLVAPCGAGGSGYGDSCATREGIIVTGIKWLSDNPPEFWTAVSSVAIAVFTLTLWLSSEKLWRITRISTIAARRSANAAVRAAENAERALRSLEIPYVFPVQMSFTIGKTPLDEPIIAQISFSLKNFGRSPAFLKETYIIVSVTPSDKPSTSLYHSGRIPFMMDDVVGDKETSDEKSISIPELVPYCNRISNGTWRLNLLVHHQIEDAMGGSRGRGAWYVWNPWRGKFSPGTQLWTEN